MMGVNSGKTEVSINPNNCIGLDKQKLNIESDLEFCRDE